MHRSDFRLFLVVMLNTKCGCLDCEKQMFVDIAATFPQFLTEINDVWISKRPDRTTSVLDFERASRGLKVEVEHADNPPPRGEKE
jgi:hypothetical protein